VGDGGEAQSKPIAYVSGIDPGRRTGGHPSYVVAHALAARAAGFSPQIFCVSDRNQVEEQPYGTLHRVATPVRHFLIAPGHPKPIARAVADLFETSGHAPPHLVHGFGLWAHTAAEACAELARRGIPCVSVSSAYMTLVHEWQGLMRGVRRNPTKSAFWYCRWYPWVRTVLPSLERRGYRRSSLVLVNYDSVARLLAEAVGEDVPVRRIPYAAPAAFDRDRNASSPTLPNTLALLNPPEAPLVVAVSRHDARKGIDVLVRALASLRADGVNVRAALVGPGRLLDAHRDLAERSGLDGGVVFPGYVEDVRPYLDHADVFVLPSLQEGSGSLSLLEALQAGCAVVASSCDGVPEDIVHGENGLLVPPGDERALGEALRRMIVEPELRARLSSGARRRYAERFSAESFTEALRLAYARLGVVP
jgi:glycosyltransferase involved in cell wall biosynthesis